MRTRTFNPSHPRFVLPRTKSKAVGRKLHFRFTQISHFRNGKKSGADRISQRLVGPLLGTKREAIMSQVTIQQATAR